ncbi:hypothetical protein KC19_2G241700 [Ceratodon purpureus]|uniref:PGG domain-containing protein n=1 Tax=Ceratodon purpureus TaxID=3225 RepID=A0A8T0J166_CERPU|nr:hypothetical protein KC19_2G241700 [Ceratodon purpureus]
MEVEDAVNSEPPFREGEPPSPPGPEVATAQAAVWKASEVVGVSEISPEIIEETDPGNGMLPSGGRAEPSVEGEAGDSAGEGSSMKDSGIGSNGEGIAVDWEAVNVLLRNEKAVKRFGQNLLLSQWSLKHRIEVCRMLQNSSNWWVMTPLSRHAYAKQSLALINKELKDIGEESSAPSLQDCTYTSRSGRSIYLDHGVVEAAVEKLVYQDWKQLTADLEAELERVREEDKTKKWYTTLFKSELGSTQPWDIFLAVENGQWDVKEMMEKVGGREHWASIRPQEYQGATPLHWAALHLEAAPCTFDRLFLFKKDGNYKLELEEEAVRACDNFGFNILHMAIFGSSWIRAYMYGERFELQYRDITDIDNGCLLVIKHLIRANMKAMTSDQGTKYDDERAEANQDGTYTSDFIIFKLLGDFYAIKNSFITPVHFLHLAIGIGHPHVMSMLIMTLSSKSDHFSSKARDVFNMRTDCGDSILHVAAWGMNPYFKEDHLERKRVMVTLLQNLHYYPTLLNSSNKAGQRPLHVAAFQGSWDCVNALIGCLYLKADVQNNNGLTPLDMAKELQDGNVERLLNKALGRKYLINEKFGFSRDKFNDDILGADEPVAKRIQELKPELCQWKLLHISQWSLRHRILTLQMLSENPSTFENMRRPYVQQCLNLVNSKGTKPINQNTEGIDGMEHIAKDLIKIMITGSPEKEKNLAFFAEYRDRSEYDDIMVKIFYAIEEDDGDEFSRLIMKVQKTAWLQIGYFEHPNLEEYKGATPLHWAALYGRRDMVISFRNMHFNELNEKKQETWIQKCIKARDEFGFTPLHLVVFSSPPRLQCTKYTKQEMEWDAVRTVELIDTLYEMSVIMGVPDIASSNSQSDFLVWKWRPDGFYLDDHLSNSNLYPMFLGVHFSHPPIVEKFLERSANLNFAKNIMSAGNSILHCARTWDGLIKHCSEDEWRKLETILFMHLENIPKVVNSRNFKRETPLHIAVRTKSLKWMEVLLQSEHVKFTLRDRDILTPGDLAANMLKESSEEAKDEIQNIMKLIDSFDPESVPRREKEQKQKAREEKKDRQKKSEEERKKEVEQKQKEREDMERREKEVEANRVKKEKEEEKKEKDEEGNRRKIEALQRDRQVYVDAANAILVGGALVASASFGAWLQPPLGFHPYYSPEFLDTTAPPSVGPVYESFVAIQQYWIIHLFWVFNSLSFFFSLATVMAGADAALPQPGFGSGSEWDANGALKNVTEALKSVKKAVKRAAWLLILAIIFVICTFATLGFTVLPPITKYRINLIVTLGVGGLVCISFLIVLVKKLVSKEKGSDLKENGSSPKETPAPTISLQEQIPAPTSSQEQISSPDEPCPSEQTC